MKKNLIYATALSLLSIIMLSSCNDSSSGDKSTKVNIGVVLPLTGELASYSAPMKQGMELAVEEINKADSTKAELKFIDTKAEAKTAVNAIMQMINVDKISYFIGDISSTTTLAMIPVIESNKAFILSPGASSPKLSGISKSFARNYPSSLDESLKSAEYAYNTLKASKATIVYVNNEYGIGLKDAFEVRYKQLGGNLLASEIYNFGEVDFKTIILKIKEQNPDMIYLAGNQKEMGNFMKQLRDSKFSCKVISNISFLEPDCINIAKEAAEGVMVPVAYYNPNDSTSSTAMNFGKLYKQKFNADASVAVAVGYDAVMLIYNSIKKEGNDPQKVADYIRNLKNYNGALGNFSFENGDINMKTVFKIVQNGKAVDIK
jgi:branched-chain amino acid transport system substrate-binding protein